MKTLSLSDRPFAPSNLNSAAPPEVVEVVRIVLADWDGGNWRAVYQYLRAAGRTCEELSSMTVFDVRMAIATGQRRMLVELGQAETTKNIIISTQVSEPERRPRGRLSGQAAEVHPDGPEEPCTIWWKGTAHQCPPRLWRLVRCFWDRERAQIEHVASEVWENEETSDQTIKATICRLNNWLAENQVEPGWELHVKQGWVMRKSCGKVAE